MIFLKRFLLNKVYFCSMRTPPEKGYLESPQQSSIHSPSRGSSRTLLLHSPHANAGMKQYECGRTQPLFRAGHDRGINKWSKPKELKGQCHETFDFWFFSSISFPQAYEYTSMAISNFFENSRRYSRLKVHHRCQRHRWQMGKIFKQKNFNHFVWTLSL